MQVDGKQVKLSRNIDVDMCETVWKKQDKKFKEESNENKQYGKKEGKAVEI